MKKIFLTFCLLVMVQTIVFADEIIDAKGNITPCKILTISDGFIEYQKDGCRYNIQREKTQAVFNDYIDVITDLRHPKATQRRNGTIFFKDFSGAHLQVQKGEIVWIPWYKIKFIGVYNPN